MRTEVLKQLLEKVIDIAETAGREIASISSSWIEEKRDGSPLTQADMASHSCIAESLSDMSQRFPIVSEEGDFDGILRMNPDVFWLIDPLDGTKEFIKGNGEYTVNIALVEEGRPVLGVISAPEQNWCCYAAAGGGAWKVTGDGARVKLAAGHSGLRVAAVSRSHPSDETERLLGELKVEKRLPRGSSLKFCAVAEGLADLYPRPNPTCLWDTAAGTIVAREAGCRVDDMDGNPLEHRLDSGIKHDGFVVYDPKRVEVREEIKFEDRRSDSRKGAENAENG